MNRRNQQTKPSALYAISGLIPARLSAFAHIHIKNKTQQHTKKTVALCDAHTMGERNPILFG